MERDDSRIKSTDEVLPFICFENIDSAACTTEHQIYEVD